MYTLMVQIRDTNLKKLPTTFCERAIFINDMFLYICVLWAPLVLFDDWPLELDLPDSHLIVLYIMLHLVFGLIAYFLGEILQTIWNMDGTRGDPFHLILLVSIVCSDEVDHPVIGRDHYGNSSDFSLTVCGLLGGGDFGDLVGFATRASLVRCPSPAGAVWQSLWCGVPFRWKAWFSLMGRGSDQLFGLEMWSSGVAAAVGGIDVVVAACALRPPDPHGENNPSPTFKTLSTIEQITVGNEMGCQNPKPNEFQPDSFEDLNFRNTEIGSIAEMLSDWDFLALEEEPSLEGHVSGSVNLTVAACSDPAPCQHPMPTIPNTMTTTHMMPHLAAKGDMSDGGGIHQEAINIVKVCAVYTVGSPKPLLLSSAYIMVICTCGGLENLNKRDEKEKVMQFLMGLNENYGPVRGQILLMQPLPDTCRVYSLVLQQEKHIEVSLNRDNVNHHAMLADHKSQAPPYSFADQNNKTIQVHQLHGKNVKPPNQRRSNANHAKSIKVTETGAKPSSSNDGPGVTTEEYNQVMALLPKNNDCNSPHFANATDPKCMPKSTNIQMPDGGPTPIESIGSFHDADTRKMIGLGKQHNGLYYLAQDQNPVLTYNICKHSNLWHQRLRHPSSGPLQGHRVYDLSTHKFFSTHDVVFYEQIFPFHIHPRELHQDEVVLPLSHNLDIQPLPTPIGPNSVEPLHYDTANSHNNTTEPTTESRTEPTTDPTEPKTLDHPIVQPPSPIPYLRRGERVKQLNTMLRDFHLYNMAMVAPSQSSSPSGGAGVVRLGGEAVVRVDPKDCVGLEVAVASVDGLQSTGELMRVTGSRPARLLWSSGGTAWNDMTFTRPSLPRLFQSSSIVRNSYNFPRSLDQQLASRGTHHLCPPVE
ncbi:hypothetical protein RHSIM_Rhsim05G0036400 [Rhododendron simsii]|uniref:Uncharacterized protein n=1 Tax=Rhododendron simsii TaxID=118357 RepID=A0A834LR60_RHOSS|nr:hypothetical protein RHSIM_Rhsim05G0036400 [Rhododendron simsii]